MGSIEYTHGSGNQRACIWNSYTNRCCGYAFQAPETQLRRAFANKFPTIRDVESLEEKSSFSASARKNQDQVTDCQGTRGVQKTQQEKTQETARLARDHHGILAAFRLG